MRKEDLKDGTFACTSEEIKPPEIDHIIWNDPVTVVFWEDGTKTVVKNMKGNVFSKEDAIVNAMVKKLFGSRTKLKKYMSKFIKEDIEDNTCCHCIYENVWAYEMPCADCGFNYKKFQAK